MTVEQGQERLEEELARTVSALRGANATAEACVKEMRAAEAARDELARALEEAIEFADEGWAYAGEYFRAKWGFDETMARLRDRALSSEATKGEAE